LINFAFSREVVPNIPSLRLAGNWWDKLGGLEDPRKKYRSSTHGYGGAGHQNTIFKSSQGQQADGMEKGSKQESRAGGGWKYSTD